MAIYIHGLGLRGYRGIGPEWQFMRGFCKFNFFIGANNSGKSTILNFISRHLPLVEEQYAQPASKKSVDPLEYHGGLGSGSIGVALSYRGDEILEALLSKTKNPSLNHKYRDVLTRLLNGLSGRSGDIWLGGRLPYGGKLGIIHNPKEISTIIPKQEWQFIWNGLTGSGSGDLLVHWIPQTMDMIYNTNVRGS
jgi:hypothetical protein